MDETEEGTVDLRQMVAAADLQLTPKGIALCEAEIAWESQLKRELTPDESRWLMEGFLAGWEALQDVLLKMEERDAVMIPETG